jgi:hypothetical protein
LEVAHNVKGIAIQAGQFEFYFLHCSKYSGTFRNSQLKSLSNCMPSNVLVSGIGQNLEFPNDNPNGLYVYSGVYGGKSRYTFNVFYSIYWQTDIDIPWWRIDGPDITAGYGLNDVAEPWLVTNWIPEAYDITNLSVTEVPSQNTFGLPADVVALITSRFGTVANFLRLRNQGQV